MANQTLLVQQQELTKLYQRAEKVEPTNLTYIYAEFSSPVTPPTEPWRGWTSA